MGILMFIFNLWFGLVTLYWIYKLIGYVISWTIKVVSTPIKGVCDVYRNPKLIRHTWNNLAPKIRRQWKVAAILWICLVAVILFAVFCIK
jgi:hypothetical protein